MDENERYDLVCKDRFDAAARERKEILRLLRGRNGDPGLLDDVRGLKKINKALVGGLLFMLMTLFVQAVAWARQKFYNG